MSISEINTAAYGSVSDINKKAVGNISKISGEEAGAPFVPSGTPYGWYDASQLSLNNNDSVNSWTDLSGNGYHLTGSSPVFKTNIQGSLPAVYFDNNYLRYDWPDVIQPATYFMVFKFANLTDGAMFSGMGSGSWRQYAYLEGNEIKLYAGAIYDQNVLMDTNIHVMSVKFNTTFSFINIDGSNYSQANVGTQIMGGLTLAANWDTNNRKTMYIMEFIAYNYNEPITNNINGLKAKWGI